MADSILAQVKALGTGGEVEVAKVKVDAADYDVKFKLDSAASDGQSIVGTTITITRTATPKDEVELAKIINALYVKKDGSGGYTIGTDTKDAEQLDCASTLFTLTTVGDCTAITTPTPTPPAKTILAQVLALKEGASLAIATEKINGVDYTIKFVKAKAGADTKIEIDNTATKTITITKATAPTDADTLKAAIAEAKIGGTSTAPTIDPSAGTAIMCYADFTKIADAASANCDSILFASKGYTDVATSVLKNNAKITSTDNLKTLIKAVLAKGNNDLKATSIVTQIISSVPKDDINNAAKALCPAADLNKIDADGFKTCVAAAFKGYATMNKILTNLPYEAKGVLKSDNDSIKFVDFESGLKDAAFASGQFYFDFTTTICAARPFISGVEIPSDDVKNCLDQVNTAAHVLLNADAKCGSANKADLTDCYKAIADSGLEALYTAKPVDLLVDFSANYPDVLDN